MNNLNRTECLSTLLEIKDNIPFFNNLNDNEIVQLVTDIHFLKYKQDEIIIEQGTKDNQIYIIISGGCNVSYRYEESTDQKKKLKFVTVAELSKKDLFGEISVVADMARTARVISNADGTTLLSIKLDMDNSMINDILVKVYRNFLQEVSKKILEANRKIHNQTLVGYI